MASTVAGGLSRVTVVAPRTRMDLSLPSDVPLADLLPTLLRYAGEDLADEGAAHGGWALSRLGEQPLDTDRSPQELQIRDGEVLYFTPRTAVAPEVVFDDVVDAVATATLDRPGRWQLTTTRSFAVGVAVLALLGGALAVLFSGPPNAPGGLAGLGIGMALVIASALTSRAGGDGRSASLLALVALAYAGAGGLLLLGGDHELTELTAAHVLVAATALLVYGVVATIAVGDGAPLLLGASGAGAALGVAAGVALAFGTGAAGAAAVIGALSFGIVPALPMVAYRMARLPAPSIPTDPSDLKSDTESVQGARVLAASNRADELLTALLTTVAVIILGAEVLLVIDGGLPGVLLCAVFSLVMLLRARPFLGRAQRLPLLLVGVLGGGAVAAACFLAGDQVVRLGAVAGSLIVIAVLTLVYGRSVAGKRIAPTWGRMLDIIEILLIVALVPLAAWVCGVYGWISTINP